MARRALPPNSSRTPARAGSDARNVACTLEDVPDPVHSASRRGPASPWRLAAWGLLVPASLVLALLLIVGDTPARESFWSLFSYLAPGFVVASLLCGAVLPRFSGVTQLLLTCACAVIAPAVAVWSGNQRIAAAGVSAAWLCLLGAIVNVIGGRAGALLRWAIATGFVCAAMAWFLLVAADSSSLRLRDGWRLFAFLTIASLGSAPPPRWCERTVAARGQGPGSP
jgi:hypothetical protein